MEMIDYHKLQVVVHLDAIYQRGVQDGRRQVSQTKAAIAEKYDNRVATLEALVVELRRKLQEARDDREGSS